MKRFIVCAAALSFMSVLPVMASEIRVVNPDGSVSVLEMPDPAAPAPAPSAPSAQPKVHVFKEPAKDGVEDVLPKVEQDAEPDKEQDAVVKPVQKPSAKKARVQKASVPPKPAGTKPYQAPAPIKQESPGRVVEKPAPLQVAPGTPITEKLAKQIALPLAPPARRIDVFPRVFEDKPAYLVRFATENGPFDVLIDMESGDILATKK